MYVFVHVDSSCWCWWRLLSAFQRLHKWKATLLHALILQHSFQFSRAFAYFTVVVVVFFGGGSFFCFFMTEHKTKRPHAPLVLLHLQPCCFLHRYHNGLHTLASVGRVEGMMMVSMHTYTHMRMEDKTSAARHVDSATHKCSKWGAGRLH